MNLFFAKIVTYDMIIIDVRIANIMNRCHVTGIFTPFLCDRWKIYIDYSTEKYYDRISIVLLLHRYVRLPLSWACQCIVQWCHMSCTINCTLCQYSQFSHSLSPDVGKWPVVERTQRSVTAASWLLIWCFDFIDLQTKMISVSEESPINIYSTHFVVCSLRRATFIAI